jgi:hypothetical protein
MGFLLRLAIILLVSIIAGPYILALLLVGIILISLGIAVPVGLTGLMQIIQQFQGSSPTNSPPSRSFDQIQDFLREGRVQKTDFSLSRMQIFLSNNNGEQAGPYSFDQIQDFLRQRLVQMTDLSRMRIFLSNTNGQQVGPYSFDQIQDFLRQGLI